MKLIKWLCRADLREELEGNLLQYYKEVAGSPFKKAKYWYQVLNYLRPSTLKRFKTQNKGPMFIFNPILTVRNLYKQRSTSIISISGFTIGLVATFFLFFYIHSELSYDSFHQDKEQIYRAVRVSSINGSPYNIGVTSGPFAKALENDFPDAIKSSCRVYPESGLVSFEDKRFFEDRLVFADQNFFQFFTFPLASGEKDQVLNEINSAVISKTIAKKYFGDQDPIGKIITIDNQSEFIITGIADDLPTKSHIEYDIVLSIGFFDRFDWFNGWWNNGLMTYVHIPTPQMASGVKDQLSGFMDKYFGEDFARSGSRVDLALEPFEEIYFNRETRYDPARHGSINSIYILSVVAIAILFIACFNYVNLSIAQSFARAKEVGVRKVLGGRKERLVLQFLGESFLVLVLAILLSIGLCELLNPLFNRAFDLQIDLDWTGQNVWIFLVSLLTLVLVTSGLYPSLLLSSFHPIEAMKGSRSTSGKTILRKGLVIAQFSISIFLIIATLLISIQTNYLNSKDLGFNKEAIVLVDINNQEIRNALETFKDRLTANANILEVSSMSGEPGGFHDASGIIVSGIDGNHRVRTVFCDRNYLNLFGVEVIAGRNFDETIGSDEEDVYILNEQAVSDLGLTPDEVIGKKVRMPGWSIENAPIIGVVKNFHFNTLKDEIEPMAIISGNRHRRVAVKISGEEFGNSLLFLDEVYKELSPAYPMSYEFLDESLKELYENEEKQARIFTVFSGMSIFLACLGIFGLAAYSAQRRQKELGIRKVLGATARQIIALISKEFMLLVLIAALIATPSVWYFIEQWLGDFAYRISVHSYWYVFLFGGIIAILIALITVSMKTFRAAVADPTESIRDE